MYQHHTLETSLRYTLQTQLQLRHLQFHLINLLSYIIERKLRRQLLHMNFEMNSPQYDALEWWDHLPHVGMRADSGAAV